MTHAHSPRWLLLGSLLGGCSDGSKPSSPAVDSDSVPPPTDTAAPTDSGGAPTGNPCLEQWADGVVPVDPSGPDTQIHTDVAFDGTHVWFVWNRPNASSTFDIFATAMACDGSVVVEPFVVSDSTDNEIDPTMAIHNETLMVAWSGSTSAGIDIRYRALALDGSPISAVQTLTGTRGGVPVTGNATLPDLVPLQDGFLLAGSWGHEDAPAFQAFGVELSADGTLRGDATDAELDTEFGQLYVDATVHGGQPHLIWQIDSVSSTAPALRGAPLGEAAEAVASPGARPSIVSTNAGLWRAWDTNEGEVVVWPPEGAPISLDLGAGFHHTAHLATDGDSVLLLVMEQESSVYARLRLLQLDASGVAAEWPLAATGAPSPYEASLVMAGPEQAVVVWQAGENPAFRSYAEWVTLTP